MAPVIPITVYTLTLNEARQIREVLDSVRWADDLLVVDSFSTDGTAEIARECGARVLSEKFCGFGRLRNLALNSARHDWILSIDADERCTPELAAEVQRELAAGPLFDAYLVPRQSHFLGRWMRHGGWYPDYRQPQFFNRNKMRYAEDLVHEGYVLHGRLGYCQEHAVQFPWPTLEIATGKLQRYSTLMARRYFDAGRKASLLKTTLSPWAMFLKVYLVQRGFLDGRHGLLLAALYGYYTFLKHAKLWELQRQTETHPFGQDQPPLPAPPSGS